MNTNPEVFMSLLKNIICLSLICAVLITGCGVSDAGYKAQTPEDAIHTALTALKKLDMETFNACTNNQTGEQYRIFSDLFREKGKSYLPLAEAIVANLSWEINDIQEDGDTATAQVTIYNKDFSNAVGNYIADMIRYVDEQHQIGADLSVLIGNIIKEVRGNPELLLPYLEECTDEISTKLTINLTRVDNTWQIQLDDTLCEALLGYSDLHNFSEDFEQLLKDAEDFLNNNLKRWGIEIENGSQWMEQLGKTVNNLFH